MDSHVGIPSSHRSAKQDNDIQLYLKVNPHEHSLKCLSQLRFKYILRYFKSKVISFLNNSEIV